MPQPGNHKYDIQRTRLRVELDNSGIPDGHADELANEILREREGNESRPRSERGPGPKGER